jgi:hypothetical protein
MALTLKERCKKRLDGLKQARQPYEPEWREIASLAQPARSRWLNSDTNKNARQRNSRLQSSHGIFAFRTLQGGMTSGLSSPSRPWFKFSLYDEDLLETPEVKAYLDEAEKRVYAFLAQTNFYGAAKSGYLEIGLFGTEACVMVEHPTDGAVCHQLTAGEYWIGLGSNLQAAALYRRCPLTVIQAVQTFGPGRLSQRIRGLYDKGSYDEVCNFFHAIEENDEFDDSYADVRGKPYRSVYWDEQDASAENFVSLKGYEEQPFWAPRWDTVSSDVWGIGPGHDALPDLRELQLQSKRKGEATDLLIWPEVIAPAKVKLRRQPKSVVSAASLDAEKVLVPYEVPYQAVSVVADDVNRCKEDINRAAYADLFMAITNMAGIQPRNVEEIAARNEEKLTQLGPVIERVNNEKLGVALDRTFGLMERAGLLPQAPDALRNTGGEIKVEYVSILTQMQRMVGLGQIERTVGFIGAQAAVFPEAIDKLNIDQAIDEYADRAGTPSRLIRSQDEVDEIRDDRAQQENMQRVLAAAPAAKDGAQAAALMADVGKDGLPMAGAMPL